MDYICPFHEGNPKRVFVGDACHPSVDITKRQLDGLSFCPNCKTKGEADEAERAGVYRPGRKEIKVEDGIW
jgi:hypothetical protein